MPIQIGMRTKGTATELENTRRRAVGAITQGYTVATVAAVFHVHQRTVRKWIKAFREQGDEGLKPVPASGRPRKLSPNREAQVLSWFTQDATKFGFRTNLWTAPRVCELIKRKFHIHFHARYLNHWLALRRITPQKPARQPRERDEVRIAHWLCEDWPRIQKKLKQNVLISSLLTKAEC